MFGQSESPLDVESVRAGFPLLANAKHDEHPLIYLDSAATSLKPKPVIDAVVEFYESYTANIHRGVHVLSERASDRFDSARDEVARFINADLQEVVFVRNTTEAVNLVARNFGSDAAVLYGLDAHHSNLLPWHRFRNRANVRIAEDGGIDMNDLEAKLGSLRPDLVAVTHVSNAFGAVNPVETIIEMARRYGAQVLVDASQSVPHKTVDVREMDCDYLCFSGHKMCGPSGIGVLYGKAERLASFAPLHYGGDMVAEVHEDSFEVREIPERLEAGTPNIEGAIGLAAACEFLDTVGMAAIEAHEHGLVSRAISELEKIEGVRLFGPGQVPHRGGSLAFTVDGLEAHGVSRMLSNRYGICVRSGFHCAQPAHEILGFPPTVRASFYLYNDNAEVDQLADALSNLTVNMSGRQR